MKQGLEHPWPAWNDLTERCRCLTAAIPTVVLPSRGLRIVQIRPFRMPRGWRIPPHEHSYYEANLILRGRARPAGRGARLLGPGHVFFHAPAVAHTWGTPAGPCLRLIVEFVADPPLPVREPAAWPCWPDLLDDAAKLFDLAKTQAPGWRDQAAARLGAILARILTLGDLPASAPIEPPGGDDRLVEIVNRFLGDNLHRPIQLESVAMAAGVSLSGLTHRYRHRAGVSVGQQLMALRMEKAAHLLKTTELPLKEVARQVGIPEAAYFCRLVKRFFSDTPGEVRQRARKAAPS